MARTCKCYKMLLGGLFYNMSAAGKTLNGLCQRHWIGWCWSGRIATQLPRIALQSVLIHHLSDRRKRNSGKYHPSAAMGPLQGRRPCQGRIDHGKLENIIHWQPRALSSGGASNMGRIDHCNLSNLIHWQPGALSTGGALAQGTIDHRKPRSIIHLQPRTLSKGGALALGRIDHGNLVIHRQLWALPREVPLLGKNRPWKTSIRLIHRLK